MINYSFRIQKIAQYDPYSIKEIEFFVEKRTKYATLKSILISCVIFALTIFVNYESLQDIWAKKADLQILSSFQKTTSQSLTSNYMCVISRTLTTKAPNSTLYAYNRKLSQNAYSISQTTSFNSQQSILGIANGRDFYCYDISGAYLNQAFSLRLTSTIYILSEILQIQNENYYYLTPPYVEKMYYQFYVKKFKATLEDSLLVEYEPEEIIGLSNDLRSIISPRALGQTQNLFEFISQFTAEDQLTQFALIKRRNIGQILGNFFSWLTIFILIFTFLIAPIVDFNFKLDLCKKIYDNKAIQSMTVSIQYFIDKKGIFEQEDILQEAFEKLEKDLDILNLLKKQNTMGKLIVQNSLDQRQQKDQLTEREIELFIDKELLNQNDKSQQNQSLQSQQEKQVIEVSKDQQFIRSNIIRSIMGSFDIGETAISLLTNKGRGYRTSWSTILTVIFMVAAFTFLIVAGVFTLSKTYETKTMLQDRVLSLADTKTIQINPEDMIFRALKASLADNFLLQVKILSQNYDILDNITLRSGSACDSYVQGLGEVVGSGWLCLSQPFTVSNNGKYLKRSLGIKLTFPTAFGFTSSQIEITYKQTNLINEALSSRIVRIKSPYDTSLYVYELQLIDKMSQDSNDEYWTSYIKNTVTSATFPGISFDLQGEFIMLDEIQKTLWDVIDTSWGIFILSFTILLSKLTGYLNVRERGKITNSQQNEQRNDILGIILQQHKTIHKVFPKETEAARYFSKRALKLNED